MHIYELLNYRLRVHYHSGRKASGTQIADGTYHYDVQDVKGRSYDFAATLRIVLENVTDMKPNIMLR